MPNPETPTKPETAPQQETGGGCQQEPCSALGLAVIAWDKRIPRPDLRLEIAIIIHADSVAELADNLEYIASRIRETGWSAGSGGGKHSKSVWEMFRQPNIKTVATCATGETNEAKDA